MDTVWLYDTKGSQKSRIWDAICAKMAKDGYWKKTIIRTLKPSFSECRRLKASISLPEKQVKHYENFYNELLKDQYRIMDMLIRKTDWGTDRYNSASFHEISNRIRMYSDFAIRTLLSEKITLVMFCTIPHMGWDYIFYRCAKFLDIRTLLLDQAKIPNRFFHCFEFEDFGSFKTSKILDNKVKIPLEKKIEKDWFYMKQNQGGVPKPTFSKLTNPRLYKKKIQFWIESNDYLRLITELFSSRKRPQAFFRFYIEKKYQALREKNTYPLSSFDAKYIYFPLHKQPERSTTIWGGVYIDQALAIERLAQLIPDDWYIYVKENPKQCGAYRDHVFFDRLNAIPNLRYLPSEINTHELIRHSMFVATIVGTAGWEAITGGKNVMIFGWGAWYKNSPGVYQYHEDMDVEQLVKKIVDHEQLEKKTAEIMNKCGTGIIDLRHLPSMDSFCLKTNTQTVVESLVRILYKHQ